MADKLIANATVMLDDIHQANVEAYYHILHDGEFKGAALGVELYRAFHFMYEEFNFRHDTGHRDTGHRGDQYQLLTETVDYLSNDIEALDEFGREYKWDFDEHNIIVYVNRQMWNMAKFAFNQQSWLSTGYILEKITVTPENVANLVDIFTASKLIEYHPKHRDLIEVVDSPLVKSAAKLE